MSKPNSKYFAPRKVVRLKEGDVDKNYPESLSVYGDIQAWILLGEPGAGKTEVLKHEANVSGGIYIRIAEFVDADLSEEWKSKTLFLDGLDEVRASGHATSILQKVVNQLKRLGKPKFRIACRAADWNAVDKLDLEQVSLGERIVVLKLLELDEEDIADILKRNFNEIDSVAFLAEARRHGIFDLMKNPQTLVLFTYAFVGGQFPDSRRDTFEVACEKQLQEKNDRHLVGNKNNVVSIDQLIDAAGHVFALMLLSDSLGVTSSHHVSNKQFLQINKIEGFDLKHIEKIKDSRLFVIDSNECWVPSHRTIAEFLAAKWLAKQLDNNKLSKRRLFNLMLGGDGGVISSLRGLHAWLVVFSNSARDELIVKDPLGVIFYADPKILSVNAKIQLLDALKVQGKKNPSFYWRLQDYSPMGGLAAPELASYFSYILQAKDYSAEHQVLICCVLDALKYGAPLANLVGDVYLLINSVHQQSWIRESALKVWLRLQEDKQQAVALLDKINTNQIKDDDDQLAGLLLSELYPSVIKPESLAQYFHQPKRDNYTGAYVMFWCYELVRIAPDEHIPILLDALVEVDDLRGAHRVHYRMSSMVDRILEQGVQLFGESVSADRLFAWLGIGQDEYGSVFHEKKIWNFLSQWFSERIPTYQELLGIVFDRAAIADKPADAYYRLSGRLNSVLVQDDIALWHYHRLADYKDEELANIHLNACFNVLANRPETSSLTIENLENWASRDEEKNKLLNQFLVSSLEGWQAKSAQSTQDMRTRALSEKLARTRLVTPHLSSLPSITAPVGLLNQLAYLWAGYFYDVSGDTVEQRFNNYAENGNDVLAAAKIGFQRCIEREDLPSVKDIIATHLKDKEYLIGYPCLLGMELRWDNDEESVLSLANPLLEIAIAFFLVGIGLLSNSWLIGVAKHKPALIAQVYLQYFNAVIKAKKNDPRLVYELTNSADCSALTALVSIEILNGFPLRAKNNQLRILRQFICWTYKNNPKSFFEVVRKKHRLVNSMADSQKVYWLFCANLCGGLIDEEDFWLFIGSSQARLGHLTALLESNAFNHDLSARFLSVLIEKTSRVAIVNRSYSGHVSVAEQLGDQLRGWINQLASMIEDGATSELNSLIHNPKLQKLHALLKINLYEHEIKKREARFRFADFRQVQEVLACKQPANIADLQALVLDVLDDVAKKLRTSHANPYKIFWKYTSDSSPINQKIENDCRDALLVLLQEKLLHLDIDDVPEAQYFNHKRSDIRLAYGAAMALPIEIKRDSNQDLWTACQTQLIDKYAIDPKSQGYGIYLVLWFGSGNVSTRYMTDGRRRPQSASELEQRLIAQLDDRYKSTIAIKVLDVSLPD